MPKNNNNKLRHLKRVNQNSGSDAVLQPVASDFSSDWYFTAKMLKAKKSYQLLQYEKVVNILTTLTAKYSNRFELQEALGASYLKLEDYYQASQIFEKLLILTSIVVADDNNQSLAQIRKFEQLAHYNLAQINVFMGLPFLAYAHLKMLDCVGLTQHKATIFTDTKGCIEVKKRGIEVIEHAIARERANMKFVSNNKTALTNEQLVEYATNLERGRRAGYHKDWSAAKRCFEAACQLFPKSAAAHNNLALIYLVQNEFEQAIKECLFVIEEIELSNIHALSNLVQILVMVGQRDKARLYLECLDTTLAAMSNKEPDHLLKLTQARALFNETENG